MLCTVALSKAIDVQRMEPANWWVGMENHELQVLLYGKDIAKSDVSISYPGVTLKEVAKVENPNYLFLYLDINESAKPGTMNIVIKEGKKQQKQPFEFRERNRKVGAQGFSTADVIYLITPDRFANGNPQNDNLGEVMVNRNMADVMGDGMVVR